MDLDDSANQAVLPTEIELCWTIHAHARNAQAPIRDHRNGGRAGGAATAFDIAAFLQAPGKIGYDGPMRAEPFNP